MVFDNPSGGPATPMAKPWHAIPDDDPRRAETGSDWLITDPVIGPSDHMPPAPGSPSTIEPLSIATATSLAARLNWKIWKQRG